MRTPLAMDGDVLAFARAHAEREHVAPGEAMSRLARDGIQARNAPMAKMAALKSNFSPRPACDASITTDHVHDLMDQETI